MTARPTDAGPSRRQWLLLICLFVVSLPAVTPRIYSSDEIQYFAYLRSIWFDRDLSFENEYRYFYDRGVARSDGFHETFLERATDTGRRLNFGTIGCAVLWTPFYAAGHLAAVATGAPRDGYSPPYIAAVAYGSAVYGFLALVLAIRSAARLGLNAFGAGLAVWAGTSLLFYMYVAPPFSHACSAFTASLFIYFWLRVRGTWAPAGLAALGAAGALMAMTREQDVFFLAGPFLDFVFSAFAARGLIAAAAFLVVYTPQLAAYRVLNGHFGPHASVAHKMKWSAPHALQVLFSPEHGFFVWTPLALLALGAVAAAAVRPRLAAPQDDDGHAAARRTRVVWVALLVMAALQIYVGGSVDSWTVAGGFGQRRFVALSAILVIGLAALTAPGPRRPLWLAMAAACAYWNVALTAEFAIGLMDRQKLEPARNAYDAVITLPRTAPVLAYRYLFDRASFYHHAQ